MKKVKLTLIAISLLVVASAQQEKDNTHKDAVVYNKKSFETEQIQQLSDTTPVFTIRDYNQFYNDIISKLPTAEGLAIIQWWQQLAAIKIKSTETPKTTK